MLTHYDHWSWIDAINWKQVRAELLIHKLFKFCPVDLALIDTHFYHSFRTNNGYGRYARSPVLRLTFDRGSVTD